MGSTMISERRMIEMSDGIKIHCDIHESGHKWWIIASHGAGEHLERHDYLSHLFNADFNVLRYDLRGHGRSEGKRAYVSEFTRFFVDLDEVISYLRKEYKMENYALFGHSMGGLITAGYLQNYAKKDFYPGLVFFNAPPAGYNGVLGKLVDILPVSAVKSVSCLPSVALSGLVDIKYLSHDPRVSDAYKKDELVSLSLHTHLLFGMAAIGKQVFSKEIKPDCPTYCTGGSGDQVVNISMLKKYFETIEKKVKYLEFEGAYHEIHNEIEKYRKPYLDYLKECMMTLLV